MKFSKLSVVSALFALAFAVVGCSSTKNADDEAKSVDAEQKAAPVQPVATENPEASSSALKTVYFDFNKYVIRQDQLANANSIADALKANPKTKIQIQGNTDDRGSVEYNMALGTKRADSLKKYLVTQGVSADSVSTVSYGKERPAVQGNDESAWSQNRRDDVVEQK
ncbi:MAG: peptidoglycan-associated lipoprotein Pal [Bdellovibrionota bacterium]